MDNPMKGLNNFVEKTRERVEEAVDNSVGIAEETTRAAGAAQDIDGDGKIGAEAEMPPHVEAKPVRSVSAPPMELSEESDKGGVGAMEFEGKSVDEMREMMNDDPEALMEHLDGLSDEDRQMAMQYMNQRMQQINQMFSMMSNAQKAQHDTAKAAINNMRV